MLLIGIAAAAVIFGYALFKTNVDAFFYPGRAMTSNNSLEGDALKTTRASS